MPRKKWTPLTGSIIPEALTLREKRKWQIALRRYVLEGKKCSFYAPYFSLDSLHFRKWIEAQFCEGLGWENFSTAWQFDFIIPLSHFNFNDDNDLRLCWNFINIRIENLKNKNGIKNLFSAKNYFEDIYSHTKYSICLKLIEKINQIIGNESNISTTVLSFLQQNKSYIQTISSFTSYEYDKINEGVPLIDIIAELEFLKKYG